MKPQNRGRRKKKIASFVIELDQQQFESIEQLAAFRHQSTAELLDEVRDASLIAVSRKIAEYDQKLQAIHTRFEDARQQILADLDL